jgi:acetyl-CoA acyltransferase
MSENVWIAGVGMTRFGTHEGSSVTELTRESVTDALADSKCDIDDVDAVFFANTTQSPLEGQYMVGGQIALREVGFEGIPIVNVENACASGASAIHLADAYVRSGAADVVVAVGTELMNVGNRELSMKVFDGAYDVNDPEQLDKTLAYLGGEVDLPDGQRSIFMDIYAAMARNHMTKFGTTQEQIAAVSAKNHHHSVNNPRAHFRKDLSADEILGSRALAYPLTVPMCAPITDGSAAAVICSDAGLERLNSDRAVQLRATALATGSNRDVRLLDGHVAQTASTRAYSSAGITPSDIDVVEVHDATAFAEIQQLEVLGLVPQGQAAAATINGDTRIGGRLPVNPSGGLESKGHPLAATGLGQVFELVEQLRGEAGDRQVEGARWALAENGGGFHRGEEAVASVIILEGDVN